MIISKRAGISALLATSVLLAIIFAPSISASTNKTKSEKPWNIHRRNMGQEN